MTEEQRIKRNNFVLIGAIAFVILVVLFIFFVFIKSSNNPHQVVYQNNLFNSSSIQNSVIPSKLFS